MFSYNMPNGNIVVCMDYLYEADNLDSQIEILNAAKNSVDYYFRLATFEEYQFLCDNANSDEYPNTNPIIEERKPFDINCYYRLDEWMVHDGKRLEDYPDDLEYYSIVVRDFKYEKDSVYIRRSDNGLIKLVKSDGEYINLTFEQVKQLSEELPLYVEVLEGKTLSKLQEGIVSLQKRLEDLNNNLDDVKDIKKVGIFSQWFRW